MRVSNRENRTARWRPAVWLSALRERITWRQSAFLLKDMEALQQQLEDADTAQRQLRDKYREATALHREQRTQLLRLRVAEQLFEASVGLSVDDTEGTSSLARLLRLVMETVEAGGGILWLRAETGNTLVPQVCEGRIANTAHLENILHVDTLSPTELRARCETALRSAPAVPRAPFSRLSAQRIPTSLLTEEAVVSMQRLPVRAREGADASAKFRDIASIDMQPATEAASIGNKKEKENVPLSVALLMLRAEEIEAGAGGHVMCVVGVCDPRGQSRFTSAERERLQSLSRPLTAALCNVLQRVDANRRLNEMSLRHDRDVLPQSASYPEAIYQNIVDRVTQAVPCENCTLFLLDATGQRLEARATQGRVVNLLDHIRFARGHGVSGWVAAQGRLLNITDLTQEPNLLNVEMIPPRVRSFLAIPLYANNTILGVLNVSHSRAHAFSPAQVRLLSSLAEQAADTLPFSNKIPLQTTYPT
jgi:putative methionine-R-sulfoxide reductase with GAF domain